MTKTVPGRAAPRAQMLPPDEVRRHYATVLSAEQALALEVLFELRASMQAVDGLLSRWLGADALTPGRFQVMAVLWAATKPVAQREIVNALGVSRPTVSALVETLRAEGHVRIASHDDDRRQVLVELTASGRRTIARLVRGNGDRLHAAMRGFSDRELRGLVGLLSRLAAIDAA